MWTFGGKNLTDKVGRRCKGPVVEPELVLGQWWQMCVRCPANIHPAVSGGLEYMFALFGTLLEFISL